MAIAGRIGRFIVFFGLNGLFYIFQIDGVLQVQTRITIVSMAHVQILHSERTCWIFYGEMAHLGCMVEASHI
jgi:hypothetical protein